MHWLQERWPVKEVFRLAMEEDIPGGPRYSYSVGSSLLFIFGLQVVSGIWQLFYYVPTIDHAYNSVNYLRLEVPFGWLIHGIHYWGAQAMIILVALHMVRVFIWGAYKRPRELTWLMGVVLLLLTLGLSFTGALLPWDEKGYFAAEVGTSIAGTVPLVGNWIKGLLRGGASMDQLTLSRFFITHVAILPGLLMMFIGVHVIAFRKQGSVGPWKESKRQTSGPFWPDQVYKDMVVISVLFLILLGLIVFVRAPITGPADPIDTTYQPKPEWNFLFLYQALKAFKGAWEPVGTVGLPLLGILLLILVPFVDRKLRRNPAKRPVAMALLGVAAASIITLTITGYLSHPGQSAAGTSGSSGGSSQQAAPADTTHSVDPPGGQLSANAKQGKQLFNSLGCVGCHTVNGQGGKVGPNLSNEGNRGRSRSWLISQIQNPKVHDQSTVMPSFSGQTQQHVEDIVDYLLTLKSGPGASGGAGSAPVAGAAADTSALPKSGERKGKPGPAAYMIGNPEHGKQIFTQQCESCHGLHGTDNVPNPGSADGKVPPLNPIDSTLYSRNAQTFVEHIDPIIQHGSMPAGPHPQLHMLPFGDSHSLTQEQIAEVEAYVLQLNGVDRAQITHPGIEPEHFFWGTLALFGLMGLVVAIGMIRRSPTRRH